MSLRRAECAAIHRAFCDGGYIDALRAEGTALERVVAYVESFGDPSLAPAPAARQSPDYPLFPGLRHRPYWAACDFPGALVLEDAAAEIEAECTALGDADFLRYTPASMTNRWSVRLFNYMGVDIEAAERRCPRTHALLQRLPGACLDYPWADALLSVHASRSHLRPHCSVDGLRVRCHLPLTIPPGCEIRVDSEIREWKAGECLLFEDSFEHEVWNRSDAPRAILIADFWHPDLTEIECRALVAGFAHSTVRRQFMMQRLRAAHAVPDFLEAHLTASADAQDALPDRVRYWHDVREAQPCVQS